jgi:protein-tyrosine kinase
MLEESVEELTMKHKSVVLSDTPLPASDEAFELNEAPERTGSNKSMSLTTSPSPALPVEADKPDLKKKANKARKQQKQAVPAPIKPVALRAQQSAHITEERCRQLCLSIFYQEQTLVRSLGFTSAIGGEGKSFLATTSARALANDSGVPVILLECNWENPSIHKYVGIASTPGLAEWLRGEASESAIRRQVDNNLTIIPAGNGKQDAVRLLQQLRQKGSLNSLLRSNELLIVDLPPVVTSAYGKLMARLVDALVIVVRANVTPHTLIAETCAQLSGLPVEGVILNQAESHLPRWLQRLL